jgi:hypothetical protein
VYEELFLEMDTEQVPPEDVTPTFEVTEDIVEANGFWSNANEPLPCEVPALLLPLPLYSIWNVPLIFSVWFPRLSTPQENESDIRTVPPYALAICPDIDFVCKTLLLASLNVTVPLNIVTQ